MDDCTATRAILMCILERLEGLEVAEACGGHEALDRLAREEFDLVLSDLHMPEGNGYEVLRGAGEVPVVISTASGNDPEEMIRLGALACLRKPVPPEELLAVVRSALRQGPA